MFTDFLRTSLFPIVLKAPSSPSEKTKSTQDAMICFLAASQSHQVVYTQLVHNFSYLHTAK